MTPLGIRHMDNGCCPGHDKFPKYSYASNRSRRALARSKRQSNRRARRIYTTKQD